MLINNLVIDAFKNNGKFPACYLLASSCRGISGFFIQIRHSGCALGIISGLAQRVEVNKITWKN